eukprot:7549048-Lingulodinium_polyedra.AAC.1
MVSALAGAAVVSGRSSVECVAAFAFSSAPAQIFVHSLPTHRGCQPVAGRQPSPWARMQCPRAAYLPPQERYLRLDEGRGGSIGAGGYGR